MSLQCQRKDVKFFEEMGFSEDREGDAEGLVIMVDDQAAGAHYDDLTAEPPKNTPFWGFHSSGIGYGAELFAADDKEYAEVDCDEQGNPMVRVVFYPNGPRVSDNSMDAMQAYDRIMTRLAKRFGFDRPDKNL